MIEMMHLTRFLQLRLVITCSRPFPLLATTAGTTDSEGRRLYVPHDKESYSSGPRAKAIDSAVGDQIDGRRWGSPHARPQFRSFDARVAGCSPNWFANARRHWTTSES